MRDAPVTAVFSPGQRNESIAAMGSAYSGSSRTGSSQATAVGTAQKDLWPSSKISQPFLFWRALVLSKTPPPRRTCFQEKEAVSLVIPAARFLAMRASFHKA